MNKIKKGDKTLHYKVINKNTKHSYIKPNNGFVVITKSNKMGLDFIIRKLYENFDYYYELTRPVEEDILSLWNKKYKIKLIKEKGFNYKIEDNKITIFTKETNFLKLKEQILIKELTNYLNETKTEILLNLQKHNYYEVPIKVKYLKSKYGSYNYSKKGEYIVMNAFLATLKKEYTKFVIYHEYVHQKIKNHQKEFYKSLEKLFEDHRKYQKNLKNFSLII